MSHRENTQQHAAELRWYLAREWECDLGLRSSAGGQLDTLAAGAVTQRTQRFDYSPSDHAMEVAARVNRVGTRAASVGEWHARVLRGAYRPRPADGDGSLAGIDPERALEGEESRATDEAHALVGAMLVLPQTAEAYRASATDRTPLAWLRALDHRVRHGLGDRRTHDRAVLAALATDGRDALAAALAAYADVGAASERSGHHRGVRLDPDVGPRRPRVGRVRTVAWLGMREVGAALGVTRRAASEKVRRGEFNTVRRAGSGATAAREVADHCVRAAVAGERCACRDEDEPNDAAA